MNSPLVWGRPVHQCADLFLANSTTAPVGAINERTKLMNKTLIEKAVAVSRLMELSSAIGAAAEVADSGEVSLVTSDRSRIRIGGSIDEAVVVLGGCVVLDRPLVDHLRR